MARLAYRQHRSKKSLASSDALHYIFGMSEKITDEEAFQALLKITKRSHIAAHLGLKRQALTPWKKVPSKHAQKLSELLGVPREQIVPSEYR